MVRPGTVIRRGSEDCVPDGCYEDVVAIDEFGLTEPNFYQVKYYARGSRQNPGGMERSRPRPGNPGTGRGHTSDCRGNGRGSGSGLRTREGRAYELSENVYGTDHCRQSQ